MNTCSIIIKDEVNIQITGLKPSDNRELYSKFRYEIPGARHTPQYRLGRWDGKMSYYSMAGGTYLGLLPQILEIIEPKGYVIDVIDRRASYTWDFPEITETAFSHIKWPEKHEQAGQPIVLRDYQVEMIKKYTENPQCVISISTGAGKTIITALLSKLVEPYGKSIVIVPNKSLVTQTYTDYLNVGLDVGVYFGDQKDLDKTHTICTWQSLGVLMKTIPSGKALDKFAEGVAAVIVDEAHGAKSAVLKTILTSHFNHVPIRWGLTGTIPKDDISRQALISSIGELQTGVLASDLQEQNVLAKCHVNILQTHEYVEHVSYQEELKYLTTHPARLKWLAGYIETLRLSGNTLVLVDRVETGKKLIELVPDSVFVSGKMKSTERTEHYDDIRLASGNVLVATYGVAAVGINIPRIFNLVLVEPGKSFVRVIQSIGRGIRKAHDKDFVQIWDITGACKYSKTHLTKRKAFYKEAQYPFTLNKIDYKQTGSTK